MTWKKLSDYLLLFLILFTTQNKKFETQISPLTAKDEISSWKFEYEFFNGLDAEEGT